MKWWATSIDKGLSTVFLEIHETLGKREWTFDDGCESWNESAAMIIVAVWRIPALWCTDLQ
jgi:hypothetical protein